MARGMELFTVVAILVLFAVIAHHLTAATVGEAAATFLDRLDHLGGVAATAAECRAVIGMQTAAATRHRAERW